MQGWSEHVAKHVQQTEQRRIGVLRSAPHRIVNSSSTKTRLSMPFFLEPSLESEMPEGVVLLRHAKTNHSTYGRNIFGTFEGCRDVNQF
jgi:isopenicillin N synthase-like dioxygenase